MCSEVLVNTKQSGESVKSALKKKSKATVGRIFAEKEVFLAWNERVGYKLYVFSLSILSIWYYHV